MIDKIVTQKIDEMNQEIERFKKSYLYSNIPSLFEQVFTDYPCLESLAWSQGTHYNDEEDVYEISSGYDQIYLNGVTIYDIIWEEQHDCSFSIQTEEEFECIANKVSDILEAISPDVLRFAFDEGKIQLNRDKTLVVTANHYHY